MAFVTNVIDYLLMAAATKSRFIVRKRQLRGEQRIADIVAVASKSFAKHGFDGTSMSSIAQEAGLSIGSLYQYFPNKEAIVDAVADDYTQSWRMKAASLQERHFDTLSELALAGIERHVDFLRRHAGIKAFLDADPRRAPSIRNLQEQIEFSIPLLSKYYPTTSYSDISPVATIVTVTVESVAPRIATERTSMKRAWLISEVTSMLMCYIEAQLGKAK